jgi:hypothetical protein
VEFVLCLRTKNHVKVQADEGTGTEGWRLAQAPALFYFACRCAKQSNTIPAMRKKSKAEYFKPKIMVANKEDISSAYIQNMNKLGYVMLVIAIPDEEAHPGQSNNPSIYGNIQDHDQQVAIFREIADRIELSVESATQEKLGNVQ